MRKSAGVAVAVVALALTGCLKEDQYSGNVEGSPVVVVGDNTVDAAAGELHATLDPNHQVKLAGDDQSIEKYEPVLAEYLAATPAPEHVIIDVGTHELTSNPEPELGQALAYFATMSIEAGTACTYVVTVPEVGSLANDSTADLNAALREADGWPGLDYVDWAGAVAENPGYVDGAGRPTDTGAAAYAALVDEALSAGCIEASADNPPT